MNKFLSSKSVYIFKYSLCAYKNLINECVKKVRLDKTKYIKKYL